MKSNQYQYLITRLQFFSLAARIIDMIIKQYIFQHWFQFKTLDYKRAWQDSSYWRLYWLSAYNLAPMEIREEARDGISLSTTWYIAAADSTTTKLFREIERTRTENSAIKKLIRDIINERCLMPRFCFLRPHWTGDIYDVYPLWSRASVIVHFALPSNDYLL